MHAVISLLLQSRKLWWYSSMLLLDVKFILSCQRYAVFGNDFVFQQDSARAHRAAHVQQLNCCINTPNFLAPNLWPPNSSDLSPVNYEIWAVMQHRVYQYHRQIHSVDELKRRRGRHWACVHAKRGHFEYSLWTDNVDCVHICYTQRDLFECYIFNYEIMSATLANTVLFNLQGSALADLRYGGRF